MFLVFFFVFFVGFDRVVFFSRTRSEGPGFPFISWGSGGWRCVRRSWLERPQPFATVRGVADWPCRWGNLLQVTFYDLKKCHFAPLFHCKVHQSVMLGKKRHAESCISLRRRRVS